MADSKPMPQASEELYDRCNRVASGCQERFKKVFGQDELLKLCDSKPLDYIHDVKTLLPVVQQLASSMLFITHKSKAGNCWSLRPRDAAKQVKRLNQEERMVYEVIEEAHDNGIWIKHIKTKTGISDQKRAEKILGRLQQHNLVKQVKSVKSPVQKTYMLFHLAPSDEITGGSFYDGGDLDESLVKELSNLIVFHVQQMSWVDERKKRTKREHSPITIPEDGDQATAGAVEGHSRKKRKRETTSIPQSKDIEDVAPPHKQRSQKRDPETDTGPSQLSFPPGHAYPTAASIYAYITEHNIIRAVKAASLTIDEVQNVLNLLVWDDKLEEVNSGYRTVRGVKFKQPGEEGDQDEKEAENRGNGLTEAPCGRCPVIDLCGTGGPVNAATCVYFDRWLNQGVAA